MSRTLLVSIVAAAAIATAPPAGADPLLERCTSSEYSDEQYDISSRRCSLIVDPLGQGVCTHYEEREFHDHYNDVHRGTVSSSCVLEG